MRKSIQIVGVFLLFLSCNRDPGFPQQPVISFKSIAFLRGDSTEQGFSDAIRISMDFTDGNGDLGFSQGDTLPPFDSKEVYDSTARILLQTNENHNNIFVKFLFRNSDGVYKICSETPECPTSDAVLSLFNQRFPDLNPDRQERPISGTLTYDIISSQLRPTFRNRIIKLEVYIKDRSLNRSNTILTDSLLIR